MWFRCSLQFQTLKLYDALFYEKYILMGFNLCFTTHLLKCARGMTSRVKSNALVITFFWSRHLVITLPKSFSMKIRYWLRLNNAKWTLKRFLFRLSSSIVCLLSPPYDQTSSPAMWPNPLPPQCDLPWARCEPDVFNATSSSVWSSDQN